jgi:fatty-acyl-CoA synthase
MSSHPPSLTLQGLVRHYAQCTPHAEAVVSDTRRLSYLQLRDEAARAARGLRALGINPGDRVGLLMGNRPEWIIAAIAIGALGATVVAINTWWTPREMEYALDHSEVRSLVCDGSYIRRDYARDIEELRAEGRVAGLEMVVGVGGELPASWVSWQDLMGDSSIPELPEADRVDDVAFVLYTSGSTSAPKGVQLLHGDLIENTWYIGERQALSAADRLWLAVSLFWGFGCSNAMPAILSHGGCIVLQESFDAGRALETIERERCSVLYGTPNMIQAMVEHPERAQRDLSSLRTGATLGSAEQLQRAASLAPGICNVYGLTEIYGNCHATSSTDDLSLRLVSSGRPLPGISQRIVDVDTGRVLKAGEVGEIRVKGRVMPGYLKDAEQTTAAFDADGYFRTGDLGVVDKAGNLQFRGRLKELIKTGGINVSPAEIEAVLMTHPAVEYALVAGVPDQTRDEVLGAVVIPRRGFHPTEEELRSHCKRLLANYKIPTLFRFSTEDALPLTTTGKVQKNRLAHVFFGAPS